MRELVGGPAKTVWVRLGLPPDDLENLWLTEMPDPSVNSSFKLGTAAQVCTTTRSGISDDLVCGAFQPRTTTVCHCCARRYENADYFFLACDYRPQLDCLRWPQHTFISFGRVRKRKYTLMPDMPYWSSTVKSTTR